jgi:hypothetical protein
MIDLMHLETKMLTNVPALSEFERSVVPNSARGRRVVCLWMGWMTEDEDKQCNQQKQPGHRLCAFGVNLKILRNSDKCIPLSKSDPNDSRPGQTLT